MRWVKKTIRAKDNSGKINVQIEQDVEDGQGENIRESRSIRKYMRDLVYLVYLVYLWIYVVYSNRRNESIFFDREADTVQHPSPAITPVVPSLSITYRFLTIDEETEVYRQFPKVYEVYQIYQSLSPSVYFWVHVLSGQGSLPFK
ncbi:hypothetical protein C8J57DRAFT_1232270 [Mycena rebaudengoi]|nr:hypothetical protein C8J57DRAFT_1232270 [Mycena rebaudengoi]